MNVTFATFFTMSRIALSPIIGYMILALQWRVALVLFLLAAATDALDGAIARRYNQHSVLGSWLDPVADKILLCSTYGALILCGGGAVYIPPLFVALFTLKEVLTIFAALVLGFRRRLDVLCPSWLGKLTTACQMIVAALLLSLRLGLLRSVCFYWIAVGGTLFLMSATMVHYAWAYRRSFTGCV